MSLPTCLIVTGRPGSGKTTLAKALGERLRLASWWKNLLEASPAP